MNFTWAQLSIGSDRASVIRESRWSLLVYDTNAMVVIHNFHNINPMPMNALRYLYPVDSLQSLQWHWCSFIFIWQCIHLRISYCVILHGFNFFMCCITAAVFVTVGKISNHFQVENFFYKFLLVIAYYSCTGY
jgi:maltodextrin utilization protein YvdJ